MFYLYFFIKVKVKIYFYFYILLSSKVRWNEYGYSFGYPIIPFYNWQVAKYRLNIFHIPVL